MEARQIIKKYLKDNGYSGLYNDGKCGCELKDLMPCCENYSDCEAGYKIKCSKKCERYITCDWRYEGATWCIQRKK